MIHRSGHHSTIQEWFEIKICGKCGKANAVTRKYCTGCGASLLKKVEAVEPEPVEEPEEVPAVETPSFPEDEPLVRPSEVASEQVEMERDVPATYEETKEAPPIPEDVSFEPEEEKPPESGEMEYDRGKEVVKDILEKVKAAEARTRGEEIATSSETDVEAPPEEGISDEIDEPIVDEEPEVEDEVEETHEGDLEPPPPEEMLLEEPTPFAPIPDAPPSVSMAVDEPARDEKIRVLESDIKAFNIEREQLQSESDKLRARLDEEVERYLVVAETKRTRAESLERELSLAKKEYSDANKEHKNAENRRKKELSNAEKRIRDVDKRIKKSEDAREKRIRDLERERLKREEEEKKD
jgi:hypothetical protein